MGIVLNILGRQVLEPEFISLGKDLFDSEEMTDNAYTAFLNMMASGFESIKDGGEHIGDIANLYAHGAYMGCCERLAFSQYTDIKRTDISRQYYYVEDVGAFFSVHAVDSFPRGVMALSRGDKYKLIRITKEGDILRSRSEYFTITKLGVIAPTTIEAAGRIPGKFNDLVGTAACASFTIGALDDKQHLWTATVREPVLGAREVPLVLGLDIEQVKSLFYARTIPVTESGRKRPILHLVRAHHRRLREGIDIDVCRHIRGVDAVTLDGLAFELRPPESELDLWRRWR